VALALTVVASCFVQAVVLPSWLVWLVWASLSSEASAWDMAANKALQVLQVLVLAALVALAWLSLLSSVQLGTFALPPAGQLWWCWLPAVF